MTRLILIAAPLAIFLASFLVGRYPIDLPGVLHIFAAELGLVTPHGPPVLRSVIIDIRLPRIVAGMLVGGGLALSGACYQAVFRNPLVSPFTLGVSAGAGFGAALAILLWPAPGAIIASAFGFGLLAVALCFLLGFGRGTAGASPLALVLGGIVVGAFFTALLSLLKYLADPEAKLPLIEFWLLGSLANASRRDALMLVALLLPAGGVLLTLRWRLNLLMLGDDEARTLGVEAGRLRLIVVALATLIAAAPVAVAGIVGWVGLVVPHAARLLVGADTRRLLPAAASMGACYLLFVDDLARSVTAGEVPIGILTALIGAPVFAVLLRRGGLGWA
ncbi:MAG: FecCD family ABC transporter permease [Janthinobacterium lividum]